MSVGAVVDIGRNVFGATRTRFAALPKEGKYLAGAGAANMAFGHNGFFDTALNIAAVGSIFFAPLMPFVAAGYLAKSGFDLVRAGKCLLKGDITGCLTNVAAGVINAYCAMPGLNGLANVLKAGAVNPITIGAEEIEKYTFTSLTEKLQGGTKTLAEIEAGLHGDLGTVQKGILGTAEKAGIITKEETARLLTAKKEETLIGSVQRVEGEIAGKEIITKTEQKLAEQATEQGITNTTKAKLEEKAVKGKIDTEVKQAAEKAVREAEAKALTDQLVGVEKDAAITQAKEAAEKTAREAAEKAIKDSIEKEAKAQLEAFRELTTKRGRILKEIPGISELRSKVSASSTRIEEAIKKFKGEHGGTEPTMEQLKEMLDLKNKPLDAVDTYWDNLDCLDKLIESGAKETYNVKGPDEKVIRDNAKLFNTTFKNATGYLRTINSKANELREHVNAVA